MTESLKASAAEFGTTWHTWSSIFSMLPSGIEVGAWALRQQVVLAWRLMPSPLSDMNGLSTTLDSMNSLRDRSEQQLAQMREAVIRDATPARLPMVAADRERLLSLVALCIAQTGVIPPLERLLEGLAPPSSSTQTLFRAWASFTRLWVACGGDFRSTSSELGVDPSAADVLEFVTCLAGLAEMNSTGIRPLEVGSRRAWRALRDWAKDMTAPVLLDERSAARVVEHRLWETFSAAAAGRMQRAPHSAPALDEAHPQYELAAPAGEPVLNPGEYRQSGRLKVALVSPYAIDKPGGVNAHVLGLMRYLRSTDIDAHVLVPAEDPDTQTDEFVHCLSGPVIKAGINQSDAWVAYTTAFADELERLVRDGRFDLVHLHEPMVPMLPLALKRLDERVALVATFHAGRDSFLAYRIAKPMLQPLFDRLHTRIVVSNAARAFVDQYFAGTYVKIYNGVDATAYNTPVAPPPGLPLDRPTVLFVGRRDARKGLKVLVQACEILLGEFPDVRLEVLTSKAEPKTENEYGQFVREHRMEANLFWHVGLAEIEKIAYFQHCRVYASPATGRESFGIVLTESMSAESPPVASDIPGYCEVVQHEHNGLLVAPEIPQALADAIRTLLVDPDLRKRLVAGARQDAFEKFDWKVVGPQIVNVYQHAIGRLGKPVLVAGTLGS